VILPVAIASPHSNHAAITLAATPGNSKQEQAKNDGGNSRVGKAGDSCRKLTASFATKFLIWGPQVRILSGAPCSKEMVVLIRKAGSDFVERARHNLRFPHRQPRPIRRARLRNHPAFQAISPILATITINFP
jgi:hypothetical protein